MRVEESPHHTPIGLTPPWMSPNSRSFCYEASIGASRAKSQVKYGHMCVNYLRSDQNRSNTRAHHVDALRRMRASLRLRMSGCSRVPSPGPCGAVMNPSFNGGSCVTSLPYQSE